MLAINNSTIKNNFSIKNNNLSFKGDKCKFVKDNVVGFYLRYGQDINKYLRTGKLNEAPKITSDLPPALKSHIQSMIDEVNDLNKAIIDSVELLKSKFSSKTNKEMVVYRDLPKSWLASSKDGILIDKGFVSTSTEKGASLEGMLSNGFDNVTCEIVLPKNTPFLDLTHTAEKEMLLLPNSKFRKVGENKIELILDEKNNNIKKYLIGGTLLTGGAILAYSFIPSNKNINLSKSQN